MAHKIISGRYEWGSEEQREVFRQLFGAENTQYKFDLYFHWYNIVHELGHCVVEDRGISMSNVEEEMFVNQFAAAYWNHVGQGDRLGELQDLLEEALAEIPSPVPAGVGFAEYFESIWGGELLGDGMLYGYFQFGSVLQAARANRDLKSILKEIHIEMNQDAAMAAYGGPVEAESAYGVLENALENLVRLGVGPMDVRLELAADPTVQRAEGGHGQ